MHSGVQASAPTSSGSTGVGRRRCANWALETVEAFSASVNGRLSLKAGEQPGRAGEAAGHSGAEKTYVTRVLQRDRLQSPAARGRQVPADWRRVWRRVRGCLHRGRPARRAALRAGGGRGGCELDGLISDDRVQSYDLVVGADGVRSAVRESLSLYGNTRTVRFEDKNERRYKTLPLHPSAVAGTASDLNWGCRNASIDLGMDALPTMEGEMVAVLLVKPDTPVYKTIEGLSSGADARVFEESLPAIIPYVRDDDLERFVTRPISRLPAFSLVEGDIHASLDRGGVVLLGDAIKAVKPYFGQGANSALEDVTILADCLEECGDEPAAAAAAFTARADDARALVRTSRSFDGRGPLGTARFLVPLLLDLQLNKLAPKLFTPPTLRGLQDERNSFTGLRKRKRAERTLLIAIVAALVSAVRRVACV